MSHPSSLEFPWVLEAASAGRESSWKKLESYDTTPLPVEIDRTFQSYKQCIGILVRRSILQGYFEHSSLDILVRKREDDFLVLVDVATSADLVANFCIHLTHLFFVRQSDLPDWVLLLRG